MQNIQTSKYFSFLKFEYFGYGLLYLFSFYLYDLILFPTLLLLLLRFGKAPSILDLPLIFMVIDIKSLFVSSIFAPDIITTIVTNLFLLRIVFYQIRSGIKIGNWLQYLLLAAIVFWGVIPFLLNDVMDWHAYYSQAKLLIVLLFIFIGFGHIKPSEHEVECVVSFFLGVLTAFAFFAVQSTGNTFYISLDSTKALIVLPSLYFIFKQKHLLAILVLAVTFYVLIYFSTRYIILIYVPIIVAAVIYYRAYKIALPALAGLSIFSLGDVQHITFSRIQSLGRIFTMDIFSYDGFYETLRRSDPTRAAEFYYFIEQMNVWRAIFGRGFGAHLENTQGLVNETTIGTSSYSYDEIISNYIFNVHDPILEFTLAYGLVVVIMWLLFLVVVFWRGLVTRNIFLGFYPLAFLTMYWSTKGMLVIGIMTCVVMAQMGSRRFKNRQMTRPHAGSLATSSLRTSGSRNPGAG
ncbi:MAG: hypothetical protein JKX99_11600 [Robiginitomaculum sp.]|nr:hypothetical protein [Robiginitomaculum sp.]